MLYSVLRIPHPSYMNDRTKGNREVFFLRSSQLAICPLCGANREGHYSSDHSFFPVNIAKIYMCQSCPTYLVHLVDHMATVEHELIFHKIMEEQYAETV